MVTVTVLRVCKSHPAQDFPPRWRAASETGASRQHQPVAAPLDPAAAGSKDSVCGSAWLGRAGHGVAGFGMVRRGAAGLGSAWRGAAWRG